MLKLVFILLLVLTLISYLGLALFAIFFSDNLIFPVPEVSYEDDDDVIKLRLADGTTISARYQRSNDREQPTILFHHGNAVDLGDLEQLLDSFYQAGFDIFAYDYPGYGTSEGIPSGTTVHAAARAAYDYLTSNQGITSDKIILFGRSLGSGPAIELAAQFPVQALILQGAFTSAFRVVTHWKLLPWDKFDNISKIDQISCPILFIHGTEDTTVPFWHGQALFHKCQHEKDYLWVNGADHNNLIEFAGPIYWQKIESFAQNLKGQNKQSDEKAASTT